jgi:hypothetical protein
MNVMDATVASSFEPSQIASLGRRELSARSGCRFFKPILKLGENG